MTKAVCNTAVQAGVFPLLYPSSTQNIIHWTSFCFLAEHSSEVLGHCVVPEKLVIAHFVERRAHILACCTQYLSGARVGSLSAYTQSDVRPVAFDSCSEATVASEVGLQDAAVVNAPYTYVLAKADTVEDGCSEGFKLILHKIVPRLEEAFRGLDSDWGQMAM